MNIWAMEGGGVYSQLIWADYTTTQWLIEYLRLLWKKEVGIYFF